MKNYQSQAKIFKALMHPVRLSILEILRDSEQCVCHMEAKLGLRQAYISQHLMVLREAGLIQDRRDGWNIFYHVTKPVVYDLIDLVESLIGQELLPVRKPALVLKERACNCPKCSLVITKEEAQHA